MTSDLLSWTRQQIEHRKALAEAASQEWYDADTLSDHDHYAIPAGDAEHIAHNDPQQVITDCEADLAILDDHEPEPSGQPCEEPHSIGWCAGCAEVCKTCPADPYDVTDAYPCPTVRRIASRYRHRPGYRPEWAPERTDRCPS